MIEPQTRGDLLKPLHEVSPSRVSERVKSNAMKSACSVNGAAKASPLPLFQTSIICRGRELIAASSALVF
jgi:hypothetical protein